MSLHPEVEKEIEAGPLAVEVDHDTGKVKKREHPQEFARRCVEFAVEKEREEIIAICAAVAANWNASVDEGSEVHGYETAVIAGIEYAIRRRGKP